MEPGGNLRCLGKVLQADTPYTGFALPLHPPQHPSPSSPAPVSPSQRKACSSPDEQRELSPLSSCNLIITSRCLLLPESSSVGCALLSVQGHLSKITQIFLFLAGLSWSTGWGETSCKYGLQNDSPRRLTPPKVERLGIGSLDVSSLG